MLREGFTPDRARLPFGEIKRLEEIAALDLFSDEVGEILDDLTEEAAARFGLPISLVSVVMDRAQHFAASYGLRGWLGSAQGTPVEWSFCKYAVEDRAAFVVEDATKHARVKDNPLVREDGIRCYAGVPLVTSRGYAIGSFCVIGDEARSFSAEEVESLRHFARVAVERIERRADRRDA